MSSRLKNIFRREGKSDGPTQTESKSQNQHRKLQKKGTRRRNDSGSSEAPERSSRAIRNSASSPEDEIHRNERTRRTLDERTGAVTDPSVTLPPQHEETSLERDVGALTLDESSQYSDDMRLEDADGVPASYAGANSETEHGQTNFNSHAVLRDPDTAAATRMDQPTNYGAEQRHLATESDSPRTAGRPIDPQLSDVVDLSNTEDFDYATRYAPAVTHETVYPVVHNIREERVTREIHNHDIYHRILPIVDVQVLPPRHFVPDSRSNRLVEVAASDIPGRTATGRQDWVVAETLSSNHELPTTAQQFTARRFEGSEGDYNEYVGEDGVPRTETTWVHAPEFESYETQRRQVAPPNSEPDRDEGNKPSRRLSGSWVDGIDVSPHMIRAQ